MLEIPISKEEIRNAVWGCGENKSPGPDGFTFEFFRKYWHIVGTDFCLAVEWFFNHDSFSVGCNSSFIALIPKSLDPKLVSDFRPISLIGSVYKVITKILQNRLSFVISDLISDVQSAFLPNRQILDGPFILNDLLARYAGIFTGVRIDATMISHLFYADDAVFIGEWSQTNIRGINVGGNNSLIKAWDESINKLKTRLSKWKLKTLSIGGRLTLLKSVLGSTPIYNMSLYKVPKAVLSSMEAIRMDFFNGSKDNDMKIAWVKLAKVLAPRKHGEVKVLKDQGIDFLSHCKIKIGNGRCTRFWTDLWIGDDCFCHKFPRLYALEVDKDCYVDIKLKVPVASSFCRMVRGGVEASQLAQLNDIL
ncbi:hypothetical protein Tco_1508375 [Tanacetum coccineum]